MTDGDHHITVYHIIMNMLLLHTLLSILVGGSAFTTSSSSFSLLLRRRSALAASRDDEMLVPDNPSIVKSYVRYPVYKGKGALSARPVPPSFASIGAGSRTLSKEGGMLLEFATSSGQRMYDWANKGSFLLDVTECGAVLMLDSKNGAAEFLHDPNMGGEKQGEISKKLKIAPAADGDNIFLSLQIKDKSGSGKQFSVPLSAAEFCVLRNLIQFSLPRFVGFDCVWGSDSSAISSVPIPPPAPWANLAE